MMAPILTSLPAVASDFGRAVSSNEFLKSLPIVAESQPASPGLTFSPNAIRRLSGLIEGAGPEGTGGYAGWVTRIAIEQVGVTRSSEPLPRLLGFMERGGRLEDYERTIASFMGERPLFAWPWYVPARWKLREARYHPVSGFNLSAKGRILLARAVDTLGGGSLLSNIEKRTGPSSRLLWLERVLRAAEQSPLAALRLQWLDRLLEGPEPLLSSKLRELGDTDLRLLAGSNSVRPASQQDGYLGDPDTAKLLLEVQESAPALLDPMRASSRRDIRRGFLEEICRRLALKDLQSSDAALAFRLLEDPVSARLADAIDAGTFSLRFLASARFDARVADLLARAKRRPLEAGTQDAVYLHEGLVERQAVLAIRVPPLKTFEKPAEDVLFEILAMIVHEFQHHEDVRPEERRTPPVVFRLELRAHAREFLWRAAWGDTDWLEDFTVRAPLGFALRFRDHFEKHYRSNSAFPR